VQVIIHNGPSPTYLFPGHLHCLTVDVTDRLKGVFPASQRLTAACCQSVLVSVFSCRYLMYAGSQQCNAVSRTTDSDSLAVVVEFAQAYRSYGWWGLCLCCLYSKPATRLLDIQRDI
jgi:hypothetical protein